MPSPSYPHPTLTLTPSPMRRQTFADQQKAGHATLKDIQARQEVEAEKQREHEATLASNCKTM